MALSTACSTEPSVVSVASSAAERPLNRKHQKCLRAPLGETGRHQPRLVSGGQVGSVGRADVGSVGSVGSRNVRQGSRGGITEGV